MQMFADQKPVSFIDRRNHQSADRPDGHERRQFRDAHTAANPDVIELGEAIDGYKLQHRRRFITFEELHQVITSLGYHK